MRHPQWILTLALLLGAPAWAADPLPEAAATSAPRTVVKARAVPARGLFDGERLTPAAREQLDTLLAGAADLDVEVALLVPTGPWKVEGKVVDERSLTPGRLRTLKEYLAQRGVAPNRIYVESRIDASLAEPHLRVELVGTPAPQ